MKTVYAVLKEAREIISERQHWTQGTSARTKPGRRIDPNHPEAYSFCSVGAIHRASPCIEDRVGAVTSLNKVMGLAVFYNDTHTHEEVLEMFDKAIELVEETVDIPTIQSVERIEA